MIPYIFLVMAKVNMPHHGKEPSRHTSSQIDQGCPHTEEFSKGCGSSNTMVWGLYASAVFPHVEEY
jgi:hypothetical protein